VGEGVECWLAEVMAADAVSASTMSLFAYSSLLNPWHVQFIIHIFSGAIDPDCLFSKHEIQTSICALHILPYPLANISIGQDQTCICAAR
jgi:hypothetical protein